MKSFSQPLRKRAFSILSKSPGRWQPQYLIRMELDDFIEKILQAQRISCRAAGMRGAGLTDYFINCLIAVIAALINDKVKAKLLGRRIAKILLNALMLTGLAATLVVLLQLHR